MTLPHEEPTPMEQVERAHHFASILMGIRITTNCSVPEGYVEEAQRRAVEAHWGDVLLPLAAEHWTILRWREEEERHMVDVRAGRFMDAHVFGQIFDETHHEMCRMMDKSTGRVVYVRHWPAGAEPWTREAYDFCLRMMLQESNLHVINTWRRRAHCVWEGLRAMGEVK